MSGMNKSDFIVSNSHLLRTFVAVAETQNITRTAEILGRTQSAISVQSKKLEAALGVSLFLRESKGISLTHEGKRLLPIARHALTELHQIGRMFDSPLRGSIRVGIPDDYAESVLESILLQFARQHPEVEVTARFGCTSKFPDAIKKHSLDVAVVSEASAANEYSMAPEQNVWLASSDINISQLDVVPLAILDRDCSWRHFGSDALTEAGIKWRIAYSAENFAGVKAAIRSGLAIGALPKRLMEANMIELRENQGFPLLRSTTRAIIVSTQAPSDIVQVMTEAIVNSSIKQLNN